MIEQNVGIHHIPYSYIIMKYICYLGNNEALMTSPPCLLILTLLLLAWLWLLAPCPGIDVAGVGSSAVQCSAVGNSSRTRSQFRARHCCVQRACTLGLSTVRARSQPGQLPPLPRPQLTADITPVTRVPLTCENVLPGPPPHHRHPPGHDGVPGVRGLQLQGSHGVHSVILSGPRPGQARGEDGPRTQGSGY